VKRALELGVVALLAIGLVAAAVTVAAGGFDEPGINNEGDLRAALDELPYSYTLREVSLPETEAAFVGRVTDQSGAVGRFTVSICKDGDGNCPVPSLPHVRDDESNSGFGRVYLHDDSGEVIPGETRAEHRRRIEMFAAIDLVLCHAATQGEYSCAG
jgi:hypothetical protein